MTATALFQYKNLDSTQDLNSRFSDLFQKGIYAGGRLAVNSGAYTVSVTPYSAMTVSGMAVYDTQPTSVVLSGTGLQYIVIDAVYNDSGAASISVFATTASAYATYVSRYILVGTVNMDNLTSSKITSDRFSYAQRDQITPVADSKFLGYFASTNDRDVKYPATVPTVQRVGDFVICGTTSATAGTLATIGFWTADAGWVDFSDPALVGDALTAHVNNMTMHTTANQHAALAGTSGTPSSTNPFVTLADTVHLLTDDERDAITNALGSSQTPVGEANPFVSQNTVIAVPRVYQIAVPAAGSTVDLTLSSLSLDSFNLYLGKQGIDGAGTSSGQQYFGIEDAYGAGYVSTVTSYPVYVTNVLDGNSATVNPGSITDDMGFVSFTTQTIVRLQLSTSVAAGTRLYIRLNQKADLRSLTPNWSGLASSTNFLPAVTAYRNARASYTSAETAQFDTLTVGYLTAAQTNMYFSTTKDGYNNTVSMVVHYSGSTLEGALPVGYKFARTGTQDGTGSGAYEGTFYANSFEFRCKPDSVPVNSGFTFDDDNGLVTHTGGIWTSHSASGTFGINTSGSIFGNAIDLGAGTAGIEFQTGLQFGDFTYDKAMLFSLGGRAAVLFTAQNTSAITDLDSPLVIHQDVTAEAGSQAGVRNVYIGLADALPSTTSADSGSIYFGFRNYVGNWSSYIGIGSSDKPVEIFVDLVTDAQILAQNTDSIVYDEAHPAYSFYGSRGTGLFYVDTYSNFVSGTGYTVTNGIGFSVAGKAAFMVARTNNDAVVSANMAPLLLVQNAIAVAGSKPTLNYDISLTEPGDDYNMALRIGYTGYSSDFAPDIVLDGSVGIFAPTFIQNNQSIAFSTGTLSDIGSSLMRLGVRGLSFQNASAAANNFIGAFTDAAGVSGTVFVNSSTGHEALLEAGTNAHGMYLRGNVWITPTVSSSSTGNYNGAVLNFGTSETVFVQQRASGNLELGLGGTPVSTSTVVPDKFFVIGRANAGGSIKSTAWINAAGYFAAAADSESSAMPSFTFTAAGNGSTPSSIGAGFNYSTVRNVIDTYGDLALRDKLFLYDLSTDAANKFADHAEINYTNEAVTSTKPLAVPGLIVNSTDVTEPIVQLGRNVLQSYKNLYIRGGVGATTTADSNLVAVSVDQAILADASGSCIRLNNFSTQFEIGPTYVDGQNLAAWTLYSVWLLYAKGSDGTTVSVARLSDSDDFATVIARWAAHGIVYTHGLLVGHIYVYGGTGLYVQPSIQHGNKLQFLFKAVNSTTVEYGSFYVNNSGSAAFNPYMFPITGTQAIDLAAIPTTATSVELVFIPASTQSNQDAFYAHSVSFPTIGADTSSFTLTAISARYGNSAIDGSHQYVVRGWVEFDGVAKQVYIQAKLNLPFTVGGWIENI